MKVSDLIAELSKYPADALVKATWEGIFTDISVFRAPNGTVLLDVPESEDDSYRERIEAGDYVVPPDKWPGADL